MKTLYYGGHILTMADQLYVEALVEENGMILATGSLENMKSTYPDARPEDLQGKTMMPGFIDPHSHFFQVATSLLQVSLNEVDNTEEMKRRIREFTIEKKLQPGEWINARDYDHNIMPGLKNPTLEQLDSFAPDNPLVIHHKSGHMGLMNSKALEILNLTAATPVPEGGKIEAVEGKLTGYLEENAFFDALKKIPMAGPGQLLQAFAAAEKKYASYGITTLQDGMVVREMLPMYRMLLEKNMLKLDVILYCGPEAYQQTVTMLSQFPENRHLKAGGLKIFLDGSPQGRTAWMRQPYEGEKEYSGYGTMSDEAVEQSFQLAAQLHTQIICHCNGDGAAEQFLRCLEKVEGQYPELRNLHPVIIHGQLMGRDQIFKAAELGAMVSFFVAHVYHWGDVHIRNFGMERAGKISPANSAIQAGVNVTFHQDAPVIEPDMLETVWCAVNRVTKNGVKLDRTEQVSTLNALRAITVNAARQYGQELQKGTLETGKCADFVILDRDPLETPREELRRVKVLGTCKDGVSLFHVGM